MPAGCQLGVETAPTPTFVDAAGPDEDPVGAGHEPLSVIGRVAAHDADGERLGDVLRDGQQLRHRLERTTPVVLGEASDNDPPAPINQRNAHPRPICGEELTLVYPDDLGVVVNQLKELFGAANILRRDPHVAMRHDVPVRIPVVDIRLEDLHFLARDLRASQATDELLALAAEHAAGYDL